MADNGLAFTAVAEIAGPMWSGRALGMQNTGQNIVASLTSIALGALVGAAGYAVGFAVAALAPIAAIGLLRSVTSRKQRGRPPPPVVRCAATGPHPRLARCDPGNKAGSRGGTLSGIRVVELGQVIAGPFCADMLGDLGAEVVKVEPPGKGDVLRQWGHADVTGDSLWWSVAGRNKRSITVDPRAPGASSSSATSCAPTSSSRASAPAPSRVGGWAGTTSPPSP